jgi:CheY-like chemotaxis protein
MPRILLVDDDEAARYAVAKLLRMAGYEVVEAHDYRDGLPVLEDHSAVDLLIVDVVLPGVHGFAFARMARMKHPYIACIYITAHDFPTSEALGPVLRKPLVENVLLAQVEIALSSTP